MATFEQTPTKLKAGVKISTDKLTALQVTLPSLEILIGGQYRGKDGEMHTYGHAALRVVGPSTERVYDFGRYGNVTGDFGAEGEGILRIWDDFNSYIAGENSYGRTTKGFTYSITAQQAEKVFAHFDKLISSATERRAKHAHQKEYKLPQNYHALTNNCATLSLSGARIALPGLDSNGSNYNEGRGMSTTEKMAARAKNFGSWPSQIFMPPDVQVMLEDAKKYTPKKITSYGASKK
jgi:hypothetical protein